MSFVSLLLAAGSLMPFLVLGAPAKRSDLSFRTGTSYGVSSLSKRHDLYRMYAGTANAPSWPSVDNWWSSYDDMFRSNFKVMKQSCSHYNVPLNSDSEMSDVYHGVRTVSDETGVDPRFILAVIMQESHGCVRAPTTNWAVRNPGLMQDHDGAATCNEGSRVQTPCPRNSIVSMIRDGVAGTPSGDGLLQLLHKAGNVPDSQKYYVAARMYNSGAVDASGDLGAGIATHCYVSDIANRLTGWVYAQKGCPLDGDPPPALTPSEDDIPDWLMPGPPAEEDVDEGIGPIDNDDFVRVPDWGNRNVVVQSKFDAGSQASRATASNIAPGVTDNCAEYYRVQGGDFCNLLDEKFGISFAELRQLNKHLDDMCSNLWLGYDYCIRAMY